MIFASALQRVPITCSSKSYFRTISKSSDKSININVMKENDMVRARIDNEKLIIRG